MKKYELEIRHPQHLSEQDAEALGLFKSTEILSQFDAINWRRQLVSQLEMNGAITTFTVTDTDTQQSVRLSLNAYSASDQLAFKLDSDIEIITPQKNLFGLVTLKNKDYVAFKQLSLDQARAYLNHFLNGQLETLKDSYKTTREKSHQTNSGWVSRH
ncbi:hypothetical protein [Acinetobacter sp.]|uniref:hypothetical protein n=1 Tax=Acinetobacter sp. TaxID=472 RepID=UPI002647FC0C|nr:hypothetical protein [Acinetobacter sp.]MDN5513584.1 hypothetical protein [Acinetobacter sp.]MDN5526225.1 hypothetical protein [Acinetobacter sp.]